MEDAEQVFANVSSVTTQVASLGMRARGTGREPQVLGIPGLRGPTVGDVQTGDRIDDRTGGRVPRCPGGVCTPEPPEIPEADCQPEGLALKLRQYRGAMVACFQRQVKDVPGMGGTLRLNLTIAQSGRVARADVEPLTLNSERLNTCLVSSARHWIFPELPCDQLSLSQLVVFTATP